MSKESHSCSDCKSLGSSVFCNLSGPLLEELEKSKFHYHFKPTQYIYYTGNHLHGIHCILKGKVKLELESETGSNQIMQIVDVGGIIGYRALFSNEPSINSAIAMEDVETCYIPKEALMSLIQKSPELALKLLEKLAHEYNQMTQRFQHGINHSATERVAEALLFLRDNFKDRTWTRKEIAEWAGTTPETAMRTLSDFEEKGLIKQQGRQIHIENRKKLLEVAKIHI